MSTQYVHETIRLLDCPSGAEYDEETFLYFLGLERASAERSNRPLPLLLATLEPIRGIPVPIPPKSAAKLFGALKQSLRDTDIAGWYRQGQVVGAVLRTRADADEREASDIIERRIEAGLKERLPSHVTRGLRVRVTQQGPQRIARG